MSVAYQSWEVATGQKAYQCVMDGSPYRWQQQVEPAALSMFIHNSDETSVDASKSCGAQTAVSTITQSVLRHGECGPVSSFVLPCSSVPGTQSVLRHGESGPVSSYVLPCSSVPGTQSVLRHGECGPVSSYVLPCSSIPGTQTVLRHGECGPISSFVLPCSSIPGSERVALIGEELEASKTLGRINVRQRSLLNVRNFGPKKIHPHDSEFGRLDEPMPTAPLVGLGLLPEFGRLDEPMPTAPRVGLGLSPEFGRLDEPMPTAPGLGLSTDGVVPTTAAPAPIKTVVGPSLSSSSSSLGIGVCSLEEEYDEDPNDQEVESARRNINMSSLDEALPIRRGLSKFINGQSKSFGCLADAMLPSAMLAKPANPYAKRRKGLSMYDDRHRSFPPLSKSRSSTSGISKKNSFGNKSSLALALSMERAEDEDEEEESGEVDDHITPLPRMDYRGSGIGMPPRSMSLPDIDIETFGTGTSSFSDLSRHGRD